jgi:hypothetical protein
MKSSRKFLALAAIAALAVPMATASAEDPLPTPCAGVVFANDPAGDQEIGPLIGGPPGGPTNTKAPDNMDIRRVFFTTRGGKTSAFIQVTNLTKDVPSEILTGHFSWYIYFDSAGGYSFLRAETDGSAVTFFAGKDMFLGANGTGLTIRQDEATTGKVFEGPNGIVQIDFPAAFKPGMKLEGVYAAVTMRSGSENYVGYINDEAPDGASIDVGKPLTLPAECPADAPPSSSTPAAVTPAPPSTTTPPPSGQQYPTTQAQPPAGTLPTSGTLTADAAADKGKRKTARKKGLRVRVRCSVQCKAKAVLTIDKKTAKKLKLGKKALTIGTGSATITKAGRIPFYAKLTKKAKKALGRKGVKKFALKVAFTVTDFEGKQVKKLTKKSTLR